MAGTTISLTPPVGTYTFRVLVDDGNGGFASETVVMTVLDVTPPMIRSATATPRSSPSAITG